MKSVGAWLSEADPNQETATPSPTPTATGTSTATPTATATGTSTSTAVPPTTTHTPTSTATTKPLSCQELLQNGDFESRSGWTFPITPFTASYDGDVKKSGAWSAKTGIDQTAPNIESYSTVYQIVTIPEEANPVKLRFWLLRKTAEVETTFLAANPLALMGRNATAAGDAQMVLILTEGGQILERLIFNRQNKPDWLPYEFDLSHRAGETIRVYFGTYNDGGSGITSMYIDDVSLGNCKDTKPPATPTNTSTPTTIPTDTPTPTRTPTGTPVPGTYRFFLPTYFYKAQLGLGGRITDQSGKPLGMVEVALGDVKVTSSDSAGYYSFTDLTPGIYTITPAKSGYFFSPPSLTVEIPPSARTLDFEGRLEPYP